MKSSISSEKDIDEIINFFNEQDIFYDTLWREQIDAAKRESASVKHNINNIPAQDINGQF